MEPFTGSFCYILLKDIITFLFTGVGLVIAGMGLATWKKQIKGTKEFDTAYNLHYAVLKLRDAIKHVRHPAIFPSESNRAVQYSKTKYPDKAEEEIEEGSHGYVYEMRWDEIKEASTETESHLLAAEVLWGSEVLELFKPLNKKITELNIALQQNFQPDLRTMTVMELHNIIYDKGLGSSTEDVFGQEVSEAVKGITDYIKVKIS